MQFRFFGDSYDIVKQSLLRWLADFGNWSIHPMFTEEFAPEKIAAFERLLGTTVLTREILTVDTDRSAYFSCIREQQHVFLDPDTGIRLTPTRSVRAPEYIFATELKTLVEERPESLTLIFDQSVGRGSEEPHQQRKLQHFHKHGIPGFAYVSHACFVLLGKQQTLVDDAYDRIIEESFLPESRFLRTPAR